MQAQCLDCRLDSRNFKPTELGAVFGVGVGGARSRGFTGAPSQTVDSGPGLLNGMRAHLHYTGRVPRIT